MLEFWAKGSGLSSISLYIKDSATKTLSRDVRFNQLSQIPGGVTILGNTDDGFIHIQVALSSLRTVVTADNSSEASASAANSSEPVGSCGATGVAQHFDKIVFADVSGMGFVLVLDDIKLVSSDAIAASDFSWPTAVPMRLPVFGDDMIGLKAAPNRCNTYHCQLSHVTGFCVTQAVALSQFNR
jgi:hypothetical protein